MTEFDAQTHRVTPPEPLLTDEQSASDAQDVITAVTGLARLINRADGMEDVLGRIADFALASIPGASGVGVTVIRAGQGRPVVLARATTAEIVLELDHMQYDVYTEGPCLTAIDTRRPLVSGSLGSDARWPRFGARAARLGVHSALAVPLVADDLLVGALNVFGIVRDAFTEHAVDMADRFCQSAAVTVRNLQLLHDVSNQAVQLRAALTNRAVIDQAIGIIRSRTGATPDEAFERLKQISQDEKVRLSIVAQQLVDDAVRRARARRGD